MPDSTTLKGVGVSPGVGAGPVVRVVDTVPEPKQGPGTGSVEDEYAAAAQALEDVATDLEDRGQRAGGEAQHVLEAQAMMARDPDLAVGIKQRTDAGSNAARAAYDAFGATREVLLTLGEYFAARVTDLDDIRNRTVALLLDVPAPGIPELKEPSILVALDLAPADTALIDKSMVLAFATQEGGPTSHTSILARNLGIPAVVGCPGVRELAPGTYVMVDGSSGRVMVDPPKELVAELSGRDEKRRAALAAVGNAPGATSDGYEVPLLVNIGGFDDVAGALANGAEGVGLFRSELLFLDRTGRTERGRAVRPVPGRARGLPRQEGRRPHAGRRCRQAAAVPAVRRGAQPGDGCPRPAHLHAGAGHHAHAAARPGAGC